MAKVLRNSALLGPSNTYCAGCGHGIIARMICDTLDELGIADRTIGVSCVGCGMTIKKYVQIDWVQAAHGRACAVAPGVKCALPEAIVMTYQGDGDAASIGMSETLFAAKRNEKIVTIFVNNGVYGMTGGQTAPTALSDQKTSTSVGYVDYSVFGEPIPVAEIISQMDVAYVARGSLSSSAEIAKTERYMKKAFQSQIDGKGYAFLEILSPCPTNWKLSPVDSMKRISNVIMDVYKCGELKG